jgi:hypothetical protein
MPLPELKRRLQNQAHQGRLSRWKISLKNISNTRDATNTLVGRIKNMQIRLVKKHTQISVTKLRDRKQVVSQPVHKSDIIQGEAVIYLDDVGTEHLTLLSSTKVTYSLCDRGVRLENHFLFLVMCREQLESMSHVSSKPLSITYIRREKVDGSVLWLVR